MSGSERTKAAIGFGNPDRVPIWFFNRDPMRGDILGYDLSLSGDGCNEWGYRFENLSDGTMGQVKDPILEDWGGLEGFSFPELRSEERLAGVDSFKSGAGGRYLLGSLGITGFTVYMFLRGFENSMIDFMVEREKAEVLLDRVFDFETEVIEVASRAGFDGVHFADDWGMQDGLTIDPSLWREIFKPRYRKQCERAHELGLQLWFHSCGNILSIVPDFHEIGVDVINISQPNVVDIPEVGRRLRGKQCFMVPISYQTVSIDGTPEEIRAEAQRLHNELGTAAGGFIGYVEEYGCMGMSEENFQACGEAFRALGSHR
jgi:uroporphyrinogen decarboxylase